MRPADLAPERVWLEEDECERLNRGEYEAVRCLLGAVNYAAHANDDLQKRLMIVPGGQQRMADVLQDLRNIADDVIGTVPRGGLMPVAAMNKLSFSILMAISPKL